MLRSNSEESIDNHKTYEAIEEVSLIPVLL